MSIPSGGAAGPPAWAPMGEDGEEPYKAFPVPMHGLVDRFLRPILRVPPGNLSYTPLDV